MVPQTEKAVASVIQKSAINADNDPKMMFDDFENESTSEGSSTLPQKEQEELQLAKDETRAVGRLRILLASILIAVVGVSIFGYIYLKNSNQEAFQQEFKAQASKVVDGFQSDALNKLQSLQALSTSLTSYAVDSGSKWPFVRVQNSAQFFDPYVTLSGAASIVLMPIVGARQRVEWEEFSVAQSSWIDEDLATRRRQENKHHGKNNNNTRALLQLQHRRRTQYFTEDEEHSAEISPYIKNYVGLDVSPGPWITWWQYAPVIENRWFVNFNRLAFEFFEKESRGLLEGKAAISSTQSFEPGLDFQSTRDFTFTTDLLSAGGNVVEYTPGEPIGYIYYPVFQDFEENEDDVVAVLMMTVYWRSYFQGILPENTKGVVCVVENNVGQVFTYQISGEDAVFMGLEDLHESRFEADVITASFSYSGEDSSYSGAALDETAIKYQIRIYPSSEFMNEFSSSVTVVFTSIMLFIFVLTIIVFVAYDRVVQKRQDVVMAAAQRSGAVLASLFPKSVAARLLDEAVVKPITGKSRLKKFLMSEEEEEAQLTEYKGSEDYAYKTKPIADLFPETTIIMCDLVGFTAWSSARGPEQVFTLLETLYHSFDAIAEKRGVFKVETVGDCYVAVCGLPDPRDDHAVVMAKFAKDCKARMRVVLHKLEVHLGPETGELDMRFGLHSGPVTAGVLRGDKSRFQLFGDTINTAARMESTGAPGKIHLSEVTANLLIKDGKSSWLKKRDEKIDLKGKGLIVSYWLVDEEEENGFSSSSENGMMLDNRDSFHHLNKKTKNLIQWNVEALGKFLKQIIARRGESSQRSPNFEWSGVLAKKGGTIFDEVQEIVSLPKFKRQRRAGHADADGVTLSPQVDAQLTDFVTQLAHMYRDNPFHNFEHASHVTMSVMKLLARIVAPSDVDYDEISTQRALDSRLHDHTYGITSDPLTQFACVLSALIHDVDHTGVPNVQLVKEGADVAARYKNVSVAEQNSVEMAWALLLEEPFKDLRAAIAQSDAEVERFRQLLINVVLATDIVDKDLKALRNQRWERAFATENGQTSKASASSRQDEVDRKATIVMEHLIQASDVAHTMQHWNVYRKWNTKLFLEMRKAHQEGRAENDPAEGWYKGELGFFDFYIIPLAKKLRECGVFGVSSDEYLNYALSNRQEWEEKGRALVAELAEESKSEY